MYTLMIVEDEEELLENLSEYFPWQKLGFEVSASCQNAKAALRYLESHQVDVLLTDIKLPFMSGLELLEAVKEKGNPPLFCIMTAYADFDFAHKAILLGVEDYLVKPASISDIEVAFLRIREKLSRREPKPSAQMISSTDNPVIAQAMDIIDKKMRDCSLHSIASELNISESYFSRLFKEKAGVNFQDYLLEKKMECAKSMLLSSVDYRNNDIAHALGYQDAQNFCRIFKKYYGLSPQQFRKKAVNG